MAEHLFDFLDRSSARPKWLLRMQRHKGCPKKLYPRYANHDLYMRSEMGAFRSGRLVPRPRTEDDEASRLQADLDRLEEILKCERDMIAYFPTFQVEVSEIYGRLAEWKPELKLWQNGQRHIHRLHTDICRSVDTAKRDIAQALKLLTGSEEGSDESLAGACQHTDDDA